MHYLSSYYFFNQPLHISGIFVAHHQEVYIQHYLSLVYIQHYLSLVYFFNQPLHVSGIFVAHHPEVYIQQLVRVMFSVDSLLAGLRWKLHLNNPAASQSTEKSQHVPIVVYRCPRRNVRDFGRVFLMLNYTDITQNTYIQS